MKRIFVPTRDGTDWQRLLAKPTLHWKMGASAMTAAASWEDASRELPAEISSLLSRTSEPGLVDLSLLAALPEWQVALPGGDTTSNTDVLAICRNESGVCIVAVEAKVLEDFGPLLKDKRAGASPNQERRLAYLHELLGVSAFDDAIRYQLLHRTASALLTAQQFHAHCAVMLVHAFGTPVARRSDFTAFCAAMGSTEVSPGVWRATLAAGPTLYLAWCDGDPKYLATELPRMEIAALGQTQTN
jgi:hypothetical protein